MEISKLSAGKGKQTEKHYAVFAFTGRKCRVPLFTSRKASEEAGRKIQELADLAAAGATFPADLSRWVETMPGYMRDSLASYGVLSRDAAAGSKPLAEHLKDWRAALSGQGKHRRIRGPESQSGREHLQRLRIHVLRRPVRQSS